MKNPVHEQFGNRVRVRVCGLAVQDDSLLLVNHKYMGPENFWSPPGGGVVFNESAEQALQREFLEETGLTVTVTDFLFACEVLRSPLHAIELFFSVSVKGGELITGNDPEMGNHQIIKDVRFFGWDQIASLPEPTVHGIFQKMANPSKILDLRGYFKL